MTLEEFERAIFQAAHTSPLCEIPLIKSLTPTSESIRVLMTSGDFVDAFFNEETGTVAFALIHRDKRIFGADNTGGWHLHPFENPEMHQPLARGMSFREFVGAIEKRQSG